MHKVIRQDCENFKAGIASYATEHRQLREYPERSKHQSSVSGGAGSASTSTMPAAFATFLEELGALQLVIPAPPATLGSSEASVLATPASFGTLRGATTTSRSSTSLPVESDASDNSGPVIPSTLHAGKGKRPAKSSTKLQSTHLPPKKKQRLGHPSVDLKTRKAAQQTAPTASNHSWTSQSIPSPLPVTSVSASSAPVSGVEVSIRDDGSTGADGAASEAYDVIGGVVSTTVVSQPRRNGRLTRAASTTTGFRSMAAVENEAVPDALVLGPTTTSNTPATTQASAASLTATRDPAESALPDLANPLSEPAFPAPGDQEAWCEILNTRIPQPIASDRVTECSVAGIQAFPDWEDPAHPWQRLRDLLPESPCTLGADDYMPDKPISIRAAGFAIVVKLWRQFTGRAVGRIEHSDLGFALWERAHWVSVAAVDAF
ncbi:unnamed protein product [Phytophthora fragariaefolia]|uniref:Unnamed protein product n=1 Tax=Phytophthora fragariaefolia TaxID=1490495 RepID=A0A9W6TPT2_9STRA|nr:unnamed protein product [Phytophthora fragariaefolia]